MMATEIRHPAIAELTQDGDTFSFEDYCKHCGQPIEQDDHDVWVDSTDGDCCSGREYDGVNDSSMIHEPDTRTLRLKIEPDQDSNPFQEWECWGKIDYDGRPNDYGHRTRPDRFDGNAERLWLDQNGGSVWWQPPTGDYEVKRTDPQWETFRRHVIELASYGMVGLVVELLDGEDAYGRPIVVGTASLWGIEPFPDREYVAEVVGELVAEVLG